MPPSFACRSRNLFCCCHSPLTHLPLPIHPPSPPLTLLTEKRDILTCPRKPGDTRQAIAPTTTLLSSLGTYTRSTNFRRAPRLSPRVLAGYTSAAPPCPAPPHLSLLHRALPAREGRFLTATDLSIAAAAAEGLGGFLQELVLRWDWGPWPEGSPESLDPDMGVCVSLGSHRDSSSADAFSHAGSVGVVCGCVGERASKGYDRGATYFQ